jgi:hypothetical protein
MVALEAPPQPGAYPPQPGAPPPPPQQAPGYAPHGGGYGFGPPQQGYVPRPGYGAPGFGAPPGGFGPGNMMGVECKDAQTALIVSIVGFFCCGVVLGPIAIVLGLKAKNMIRLNPGMQGEQKATAAIAIGSLEIVLFLFYILRMMAGASRGRRF